MTEVSQQRTCMNTALKAKGLEMLTIIPDDKLPEGLAELAVQVARRKYSHVQIVPGDIALRGSGYKFKEPHHVVYGKDETPKDPKKPSFRIVFGRLIDEETGYDASATLFPNQIP